MRYRDFVFILFVSLLGLTQCSSVPFFGKGDSDGFTEQALAYYVPEQRTDFVARKTVKVRGELNTIVNLVSELLKEEMSTQTSVIRNTSDRTEFGGTRDLLKIVTSSIQVDSVEAFKKHFMLGYYLLENPKYIIKPENMNYKVETTVSVRGQDFFIEFHLQGSVSWRVFELDKKGKEKKLPKDFNTKIGVGEYRAEKEIIKISRVGNEISEFEKIVVPVKDQPISRGTTELELIDKLMERFAINNVPASVIIQ